jgi:hypothetical protein
MLDIGLKTNQLPTETVTDESDSKASKTSVIGTGGVSAQTTKPTKTIRRESRIPITTLYLRRIFFPFYTLLCSMMLLLSFCSHYGLIARYHILTELGGGNAILTRI